LNSINNGRIHLHIDIESTAGDEILAELGKIYDQEHVLVYDTHKQKLIRLSELPSSPLPNLFTKGKKLKGSPFQNLLKNLSSSVLKKHKGHLNWIDTQKIPSDTAAIHGHFQPDLFKGVLENCFLSVIFREPLERAVAQFMEWKHAKGNVHWRVDIPFQSNMTFKEFSFLPELKNFQFNSLGDTRLGDFDLIGVTECLEGFLMQLHGEEPNRTTTHSNQGRIPESKYKKLGITDDFKKEFKEFNLKDYDLYSLSKEFIGFCG